MRVCIYRYTYIHTYIYLSAEYIYGVRTAFAETSSLSWKNLSKFPLARGLAPISKEYKCVDKGAHEIHNDIYAHEYIVIYSY